LTVSNTCFKNIQKEIFETKQIEQYITNQKDAFEFAEKHGSDKQAFLLVETLKTDLSNIEEKIATLTAMRLDETFPAANGIMVNAEVFKW
jgi:hypothetical protein